MGRGRRYGWRGAGPTSIDQTSVNGWREHRRRIESHQIGERGGVQIGKESNPSAQDSIPRPPWRVCQAQPRLGDNRLDVVKLLGETSLDGQVVRSRGAVIQF